MMRRLRRIADNKWWTIEAAIDHAMISFVTECEAHAGLAEKIFRFPKRYRNQSTHLREHC